jgi:DNA invertase Pin-like site-specific DNA recombinase
MNPVRRAWLYARVSTRKKSQAESPERQLDTLRHLAVQNGWHVAGEGIDRKSGGNLQRDELARALEAIRIHVADVLVVHSLSRLGRNVEDVVATAHAIGDWGGDLYIASLCLDTGMHRGALGRFVFNVFAAVDQAVREFGSEAIREGLEHARRKGKVLGRRRVVIPQQILVRGAELRAEGLSWRAICERLRVNRWSGVPTHPVLRRAVLEMDKNLLVVHSTNPAILADLETRS